VSNHTIHNDDLRQRWYLDAEADDQRVTDALSAVEEAREETVESVFGQ
jgi:hypothetical protein